MKHLNHLCLSAGCFNFFLSRLCELIGFDCQFLFNFTISKNLNAIIQFLDQTVFHKDRRSDFRVFLKSVQIFNINYRPNLLERIVESSLGNSSVKRHLPPLETRSCTSTRSGVLPIGTSSGSFPLPAGSTSAESFSIPDCTFCRFQLMKFHGYTSSNLYFFNFQ